QHLPQLWDLKVASEMPGLQIENPSLACSHHPPAGILHIDSAANRILTLHAKQPRPLMSRSETLVQVRFRIRDNKRGKLLFRTLRWLIPQVVCRTRVTDALSGNRMTWRQIHHFELYSVEDGPRVLGSVLR